MVNEPRRRRRTFAVQPQQPIRSDMTDTTTLLDLCPTSEVPEGAAVKSERDGEIVECKFHGGAFHIPTGRVEAPPCMVPLRTYAVHVVDGRVQIEPPADA